MSTTPPKKGQHTEQDLEGTSLSKNDIIWNKRGTKVET